jgi:hypothetical protein
VVVTVGITTSLPLAAVDVKVPGVMVKLDAPVAEKASVLLHPDGMLDGLEVNETYFGTPTTTVTVTVAVTEPAEFVAVSV